MKNSKKAEKHQRPNYFIAVEITDEQCLDKLQEVQNSIQIEDSKTQTIGRGKMQFTVFFLFFFFVFFFFFFCFFFSF
jgi:hypothetical protein